MNAILDLRHEVRRLPIGLDVARTLNEESRRAAIAEWTARMVDEHASSRVFAALLPQMMRAGVDVAFQASAADAVVDELRHARLCAAVVEALGGEARAPLPELDEFPRHDDAGPLEGLLRNAISVSCLNETVSVAFLESERRLATASTLRRVLTEILTDEVGHSRLGWQLLSSLAPRIDARMRRGLGQYLVPAFAQLFERYQANSTAIFTNVVNEVIVPRLEAFDLPAREAVDAALAPPADEVVVWAATD